ncbi:MAG: hypothetical protein PHE93_00600 [Clostridia bacterium]|nr:hypothetical protein [Clostridia bacterium]
MGVGFVASLLLAVRWCTLLFLCFATYIAFMRALGLSRRFCQTVFAYVAFSVFCALYCVYVGVGFVASLLLAMFMCVAFALHLRRASRFAVFIKTQPLFAVAR